MRTRFKIFILIFIIVDLLVILGGLYWWFYMRETRPFVIEQALPADTVVYLEIKDVSQLKEDYKKTAYFKIWNDPAMQTFTAPIMKNAKGFSPEKIVALLSQIPQAKGKDPQPGTQFAQVAGVVGKYMPEVLKKQAVLAVAGIKATPPRGTLILAYDYADAEVQQKNFEEEMKGVLTGFTIEETQTIKGVKIQRVKGVGGLLIGKSVFGTIVVYTFGFDTRVLEEMIERYKSETPTGGLSDSIHYKIARAKVSSDYGSLMFLNVETLMSAVKPLMAMIPGGQNSFDQMNSYKGVLATTTITPEGMFKEEVYLVMPVADRPEYMRNPGVLEYKTMPLTSPSTKTYVAGRSGSMVGMYDFVMKQAYKSDPMSQQTVSNLEAIFAARGINLRDDFFATLGEESAFIIDWPDDQVKPAVFLAQQTADAGKLRVTIGKFMGMLQEFAGDGLIIQSTTNASGFLTYQIPVGGDFAVISPTITVTDEYLFVADSAESLEVARARSLTTGETLSQVDAYNLALSKVPKGGYSSGYVDSKALFTRIYEMVRTYVALMAMLAPPDATGSVDLKKVPETKVIADHLSNSISTDISDQEGIYTVTVSSLGNQFYLIGGFVAGAAIMPHYQKLKQINPLSNKKPLPGREPSENTPQGVPPDSLEQKAPAAPAPEPVPVEPIETMPIPVSALIVDSILLDPATGEATVTINKKIIVDTGEVFEFTYQEKLYQLKVLEAKSDSVTIQETRSGTKMIVPFVPKRID